MFKIRTPWNFDPSEGLTIWEMRSENQRNTANTGWSHERKERNAIALGDYYLKRLGLQNDEEITAFIGKIDPNLANRIRSGAITGDEKDKAVKMALGYYVWENLAIPMSGKTDFRGLIGEQQADDWRKLTEFINQNVGDEKIMSNLTNLARQSLSDILHSKEKEIARGGYQDWVDQTQMQRINQYAQQQKQYEDETARLRQDIISLQQSSALAGLIRAGINMYQKAQAKGLSEQARQELAGGIETTRSSMFDQFGIARKGVELARLAGHRQIDIQKFAMEDEEYAKAKAIAMDSVNKRFLTYMGLLKEAKDDSYLSARLDMDKESLKMAKERWEFEKQSAAEQKKMAEQTALSNLFGIAGSIAGGIFGGPIGALAGGVIGGGLGGLFTGNFGAGVSGISTGIGTTSTLISLFSGNK
ncbi:MAG: hypothetical protein ABDH28_05585 [Brevinematia bacterium]